MALVTNPPLVSFCEMGYSFQDTLPSRAGVSLQMLTVN